MTADDICHPRLLFVVLTALRLRVNRPAFLCDWLDNWGRGRWWNVPSLLLGLWLALLAPPWVFAGDFHGKVVGVADGDTITVLHDGKPERVRLQGIDCPEQGQAFGQRAKQVTSRLVFGQMVTVRAGGKDRFGRTLGEVLLPDGRRQPRAGTSGLRVVVPPILHGPRPWRP